MKKAGILIITILIGIMIFVPSMQEKEKSVSNKPHVTVSTFALYDISQKLLAGHADVSMLIPFGQDIHSYEMTPQDRIKIEKSKFFIYSGAGLEPWTHSFEALPNTIDMSQFVKLQHAQEEHHHHGEACSHSFDPHYWLDIDNMILITKKLQDVYIKAFPEEVSKQIQHNATQYIVMLKSIDALYKKRLSTCKHDEIIVSHNAFGYLASRYDFHVIALTGFSPDAMPSAKDLASLSDIVKEKGISVIFGEAYMSDALMQSLSRETGARVDILQPLANITALEAAEFNDYKLLMQLNLRKLYFAMECR